MAASRPEHYEIKHNSDFLTTRLTLTKQSQALFEAGESGQGYIGLVDIKTGEIHLVPSFNKGDGLLPLNKDGHEFTIEQKGKQVEFSMTSQFELGQMGTGDLHRNCSALLGLAHKGGGNGMLFGFGIWKGGPGVKILDELPKTGAEIPDEYWLIRQNDEWKLIYVSDQYENETVKTLVKKEIPIADIPELKAALESKNLDDFQTRKHIADIITRDKKSEQRKIKFIKNRSTQNTFSCKYSPQYRLVFQMLTSSHGPHQLNLPREIPMSAFQNIINEIYKKLDIPLTPLLEDPAVPRDNYNGTALHFQREVMWTQQRDFCLREMCRRVLKDDVLDKGMLIEFLKLSDENTVSIMREHILNKFRAYMIEGDFILGKKCFDCLKAACPNPEMLDESLSKIKTEIEENSRYAPYFEKFCSVWREEKPNYDKYDASGNTLLTTLLSDEFYMGYAFEQLLKFGADPNAANAAGKLPIQIAADNSQWEFVEKLLEKKADPNARDEKGSLLERAFREKSYKRCLTGIKCLVKHGVNIYDEKSTLDPVSFFIYCNNNEKRIIFDLFNNLREKGDAVNLERMKMDLVTLLFTQHGLKNNWQLLNQIAALPGGSDIGNYVAARLKEDPKNINIFIDNNVVFQDLLKMAQSNKPLKSCIVKIFNDAKSNPDFETSSNWHANRFLQIDNALAGFCNLIDASPEGQILEDHLIAAITRTSTINWFVPDQGTNFWELMQEARTSPHLEAFFRLAESKEGSRIREALKTAFSFTSPEPTMNVFIELAYRTPELMTRFFSLAQQHQDLADIMSRQLISHVEQFLDRGYFPADSMLQFVASQQNVELNKACVAALCKRNESGVCPFEKLASNTPQTLVNFFALCQTNEGLKAEALKLIEDNPIRRLIQSDLRLNAAFDQLSKERKLTDSKNAVFQPAAANTSEDEVTHIHRKDLP